MDRDSDIEEMERPPDTGEALKASTMMVDRIIKGIAVGVQTAIIPGQTTQADLLSAVFTVLYRMLDNARVAEIPGEAEKNAHEINRVLADMLLTFGHTPGVH